MKTTLLKLTFTLIACASVSVAQAKNKKQSDLGLGK